MIDVKKGNGANCKYQFLKELYFVGSSLQKIGLLHAEDWSFFAIAWPNTLVMENIIERNFLSVYLSFAFCVKWVSSE